MGEPLKMNKWLVAWQGGEETTFLSGLMGAQYSLAGGVYRMEGDGRAGHRY